MSNSGYRRDLVPNVTRLTFENYCDEIGISKRTVYNWLERFIPEVSVFLGIASLPVGKFAVPLKPLFPPIFFLALSALY